MGELLPNPLGGGSGAKPWQRAGVVGEGGSAHQEDAPGEKEAGKEEQSSSTTLLYSDSFTVSSI